jgi:hypothetical protein
MRKAFGAGAGLVLLVAGCVAGTFGAASASAQEQGEEKAPGRRLKVRFDEQRRLGDSDTASRSCTLLLHADADGSRVFVGTQVLITVNEGGAVTRLFKNAGVAAEVKATTLPDGRYRLDARFEESSPLTMGDDSGKAPSEGNPILRAVKAESAVTLREGETVPFASAVDPVSGEVVRIDLTVTAATEPRANPAGESGDARLRGRLVLERRHGQTTTARRPYAAILETDGETKSSVFGGSQLPVQVRANDQITVAFKDAGAGLQLKAKRVSDGRYRLNVEFSDGVLAGGERGPQIRTFESESQLFVREGETVTVASAVDSVTGETVQAELTLEEAR